MATDRRHMLGRWIQEPGQHGMTVDGQVHIDADESAAISVAGGRYEALARRTNFQLLGRSYNQLVQLRDAFSNLADHGGAMRDVDQRGLTSTFAQHILNWLITARFYLEVERAGIERAFGPESEQLTRFKTATSRAFDDFLGYRVTYKLRDYVQHGGTPISGLSFRSAEAGRTELVPHLRRNMLLSSGFRWGAIVRRDIENANEVIALMPLAEGAMQGLDAVEEVVVRIHLERLADDQDLLLSALTRAGNGPGNPAVFSLPPRGADGAWSWTGLPDRQSIEAVVAQTGSAGPLERNAPAGLLENLTPPQRLAARRASAAIAALLNGDGHAHDRLVQAIVQEDRSALPLISGLADMGRVLLYAASTALGSSPPALLGALTPTAEPDER